jgi:hypothetical protein
MAVILVFFINALAGGGPPAPEGGRPGATRIVYLSQRARVVKEREGVMKGRAS